MVKFSERFSLYYLILHLQLRLQLRLQLHLQLQIPNFASDSILCCKHFQENVNEIRKADNQLRETSQLNQYKKQ